MNVLMIGLDDSVLTDPASDTRQRHERYAAAAGHLTMLVYSAGRGPGTGGELSPQLAAYPIRGARALFALRAVLAGLRHARRPVHLITTQDPFATGLAGAILSWLLHAPLLAQNHSTFFDNPHWIGEHPLRHGLFNRLGRWVIRRAAMNRVVNETERQKYLALGVPPERVRVIPLANPAPFAAPVSAEQITVQRAAWGLDDSHKVLLWAGRPVRVKRIPILLDVMRLVAEAAPLARLVLLGDMRLAEEDIPAAIAQRGLTGRVIMPGHMPFDRLPAAYRAADVYVHTSAYEGLGRVMMEAGAAGLPVVAMDSAGAQAIITDGENGYRLPQGDVEGFAARVLALLRDPERARAMGARGREMALTRFDPERLFDDLMACWREAAQARTTTGGIDARSDADAENRSAR